MADRVMAALERFRPELAHGRTDAGPSIDLTRFAVRPSRAHSVEHHLRLAARVTGEPPPLRLHVGADVLPEQRLMLAVLEDAVQVLLHRDGDDRLSREVEAWFAVDDDGWPFSFVRICDALDVEPRAFRVALAARLRSRD